MHCFHSKSSIRIPLLMADPYAYKRDTKLQERLAKEVLQLLKLPANSACADCGATRTVRFCSVTLGVFLCNRCYGIHRNVGAHVTRTKCVGLDTWHPDEVATLRAIGNARAKAIREALAPADVARPTEASPDREADRWIRDKYEREKYYAAQPVVTTPAAAASAPAAAAAASVTRAQQQPADWTAFGDWSQPTAPTAAASVTRAQEPPADWAALGDWPQPSAPAVAAPAPAPAPTDWFAEFETAPAPKPSAAPALLKPAPALSSFEAAFAGLGSAPTPSPAAAAASAADPWLAMFEVPPPVRNNHANLL